MHRGLGRAKDAVGAHIKWIVDADSLLNILEKQRSDTACILRARSRHGSSQRERETESERDRERQRETERDRGRQRERERDR